MLLEKFELAYEGWHLYRGFYGDATSVEVVLSLEKEDFYLGVGLNIDFEGSYQLGITDRSYKTTGKYHLLLNKRTATLTTLKSIPFLPDEFGIGQEKTAKLRLECENGYLRGYLNDMLFIEYDDTRSEQRFLTGWCGVWIHPMKAATIKEFDCHGKEKTPPNEHKMIEKTKLSYRMNLEDADRNGRLAFWSSAPYAVPWTVTSKREEKAFASPIGIDSSQTHIHMFEKDPVIHLCMTAKLLQSDSSCGLLIRHAPDTAYLKVGYDNKANRWFIEDTPALFDCRTQLFQSSMFKWDVEKKYDVEIDACADAVSLFVDGNLLIVAKGVRHTGFGRMGFWTERTDMQIYSLRVDTSYATEPVDGVMKTLIDSDHFAASAEIEVAPDNSLIAVTKVLEQDDYQIYNTGIYRSVDEGLQFEKIPQGADYSGLETYGRYQSIAKLRDGTYLQVLLDKDMLVQKSKDLIHWETIGYMLDSHQHEGQSVIFHTSSMVEYVAHNGLSRIFMPIVFAKKIIANESKLQTIVHDTVVYYSDDGGYQWTRSEVTSSQVLEQAGHPELLSYAECKIVQCADGSLRLYNSRNDTRFICYSESFDFGKTWEGLHTVRELQCAKASFAVSEDPYEPGIYYLAWANDVPLSRGNCSSRTRISIARSYDGKEWNYLCDAERMSLRFADEMPYVYVPLFQIVDPSITVTQDYVYLTYGISMFSDKNAKPGEMKMFHHEQRPALIRFEKRKLHEQPWCAANVCDMSLLQKDVGETL